MDPKRLHVRQIKIEAFEIEPRKLLLIGHLDDERPLGFRAASGYNMGPGIIHDMTLELEVSLPDFTITAARASMPQIPHGNCKDIVPSIEALVGVKVVGGFTAEVKRRLGGSRGCAHLVSLLLAMSPIAVQGSSATIHADSSPEDMAIRARHLMNSCHMWSADGFFAKSMREHMEKVRPGNGHEAKG